MKLDLGVWKVSDRGVECSTHASCLISWKDLEEELKLEDALSEASVLDNARSQKRYDFVKDHNEAGVMKNHSAPEMELSPFERPSTAVLQGADPLSEIRQLIAKRGREILDGEALRTDYLMEQLAPFYRAKALAMSQIRERWSTPTAKPEAKNPTNGVSARLRFLVLQRDGFRCQLCGRTAQDGVKLEVDHSDPRSKGGADELANLWTLCWDCNRGKSDLELLD